MRVSIVIPTYNTTTDGLEMLKETVKAVREQTYEDYEIILVDDGSDDQQRSYLANLESGVSDVHVIFQKKQWPSSST